MSGWCNKAFRARVGTQNELSVGRFIRGLTSIVGSWRQRGVARSASYYLYCGRSIAHHGCGGLLHILKNGGHDERIVTGIAGIHHVRQSDRDGARGCAPEQCLDLVLEQDNVEATHAEKGSTGRRARWSGADVDEPGVTARRASDDQGVLLVDRARGPHDTRRYLVV